LIAWGWAYVGQLGLFLHLVIYPEGGRPKLLYTMAAMIQDSAHRSCMAYCHLTFEVMASFRLHSIVNNKSHSVSRDREIA
jgi:hypothetical protein